MKIKRFVAADMRQAMREVREEQGPEAVILSTRRLDEGIEVIAAIDYDESLVREAARHGAASAAVDEPAASAVAAAVAGVPPVSRSSAAAASAKAATSTKTSSRLQHAPVSTQEPGAVAPSTAQASAEPVAMHPLMERAVQDTARMRVELGSLREMLEMQLSSLAWNDLERRQPLRARVLREMTRLGIEPDVANQLVAALPAQINAEQARYLPLGMLSRSLAVSGRNLSDDQGVTALVGPTGVGKTTTIAKLAARAVLHRGVEQVALVSTDHYRIGAAAQLEHYGRLLGIRVYPAYDAQSLRKVLELLRDRHTVLIDTAGVAGSDPRLAQQLELFSGTGEVRACLVLAANTQSRSLDEAVRAYLPLKPSACILTKLDEAPSLGGALSVLIRHRLPLDFTTDGQRVPEDIAMADARVLVCRAAQSQKSRLPDDGQMAERFGLAVASA
ncbi:MAG: flagellar biosynthesis protein FlhF [Rhodanobacter sp.]|nr:MAG: flagellar biosynthesis protein FlhF [Rhodanobacter sp.]